MQDECTSATGLCEWPIIGRGQGPLGAKGAEDRCAQTNKCAPSGGAQPLGAGLVIRAAHGVWAGHGIEPVANKAIRLEPAQRL